MSRRYRLQALVEASGLPELDLARKIGMDRTELRRARAHGLVEKAADRYATRLGFVPWHVWPELLEDVTAELSVRCKGCDDSFVPVRKGHVYCSRDCGKRAWDRDAKRRRYAADPEYAEAQRAKSKAYRERYKRAAALKGAVYRAKNREELAAKARAYYAANAETLRAKERERYHAKRSAA